ncbi:MAG: isoleucine--tRNA ligase [Parvularculaceae bacterium]|nr:isoleucine--tRNA ligase [Parvularculaceae bacterium]
MPPASKNGASPEAASRDYKSTLFLPETDFPMRAGLPKAEPEYLKEWEAADIYGRLRAEAAGRTKYVLHDGPPYANGHLHMGHAFNKILKDLVVRSRQMMGFDSNYVPGWDCHGLPIEWKVEEDFRARGKSKREVPVPEFRAACRAYAEKWVAIQSEEFKRYGVVGDWKNPYTTMAFDAEAAIVSEFLKFVDMGLVYRGSKPVMWSPVEQTALAEAEIEYHDHQSTTIWVKFPVTKGSAEGACVVIWTTTPWTIPGNRAISYGPKISYGLYEVTAMEKVVDPKSGEELTPWTKVGEKLIVADKLWESVRSNGKIAAANRIGDIDPAGFVCAHPLNGFHGGYGFDVPLLAGDHVTEEDGTGFVHTAPGHGQDDYIVYVSTFGADVEIPHTVDEFGAFTSDAPGFEGKKVLILEGKKAGRDGDANAAVIAALIEHGELLARGRLTHSYPHSWRSKAPVIFRNTPQWFIALDRKKPDGATLREDALAAIDATTFTPPAGKNRLRAMIEGRPDWLVSRQRAWGVPIAIFVNRKTGEILNDADVNKRIIDAVRERGADAWFDTPPQVFLGAAGSDNEFEKIEDILDVWFDSGSTHSFVLEGRKDLKWPADLYLEGSDQHRGWFHSSLLESCGTRGRAPYDGVLTHGFVLDKDGRKMSKSLGNVVDPADIMKDYGADILRIWVASSDFSDDLRIGKEIIGSSVDAYRKVRNTIRYLLGALKGFSDAERLSRADMPELERYMLHLVSKLNDEVRAGYEAFDFKGVWRKVFDFCTLDLSAFYLDIRKDSLYCDMPDEASRRAARTVMDIVFDHLTAWIAPVLVFTMEEAWRSRGRTGSVHLRAAPETDTGWRDEALAAQWSKLRRIRRVATGAIEVERREKRIGASLEAAPTLYLGDDTLLSVVETRDLSELFITSQVRIEKGEGPAHAFRLEDVKGVSVVVAETVHDKCQRCWRYTPDVGSVGDYPDACARCAGAVARSGGAASS